MKKNRKKISSISAVTIFIIVIYITRTKPPTYTPPVPHEQYKPAESETPAPEGQVEKADKIYRGRIAIVIDDVGYDDKIFRKFTQLGVPVTFSILPGERYSKYIAGEASRLDYEIMLH